VLTLINFGSGLDTINLKLRHGVTSLVLDADNAAKL
jgi:hypothetical protein